MFNQLRDDDRDKIKNNPKRAKELLQRIMQETIHQNIVQTIDYAFEGNIDIRSLKVFYNDDNTLRQKIEAGKLGRYLDRENSPPKNYLFDKIVYDSKIEQEVISNDPEAINGKTITVFAKLPRINIPTPYKSYSPDFAYFIQGEDGKKLFLIAETKGYNRESDIPKEEQIKIEYAEKFFQKLDEIAGDDIKVAFKKRINRQTLLDLLHSIVGKL